MTRLPQAAFIHILRTRGIFELPMSPGMLLDLARHRGIFAVPTKSGKRGMVLLASLGIDLGGVGNRHALLEMHRRGEVELASVSIAETRASLRERGLALEVNPRGEDRDDGCTSIEDGPEVTYHAVMAEAVAADAATISNGRIGWLWTARELSLAATIDYATTLRAMSPQRSSYTSDTTEFVRQNNLHAACRAACAAEWNRRAGIVVPRSDNGAEDRPYLLLRPSGEQFILFKNDCREEASEESSELIAGCGYQSVAPAAEWVGNRLTIASSAGDWTLVELDW